MHPTLIFPWIHCYGLMLAIGFYSAWWLAARRAKAEGIHPDLIGNLVLISILAGIVGSRLLWFALFRKPDHSVWVLFEIWEGGLVFYGGLIAALIAGYIYLRAAHAEVWQLADIVAPSVALGQACGRIGCFLNGCCYGGLATAAFPLAVRFPGFLDTHGEPGGSAVFVDHASHFPTLVAPPASLPIHPTQLYEALSLLAVTLLLVAATPHKRRHGQVLALLCILNALPRIGVELVRRDVARPSTWPSAGMIGGLGVLAFGLALLLWARRRGKPVPWNASASES
jgi:phosphatidylglycerol:prolipoprotein diacylglycerol transferase